MGINPAWWAIQERPEWYVNVDVIGVKTHDAGLRLPWENPVMEQGKDSGQRVSALDPSIIVEVSKSSDLRKEVKKLRNVKANIRLIVTTDPTIRGEISGIPVIPYNELNSSTLGTFKETYWCDGNWEDCEFYTHEKKRLDAHKKLHERLDLYRNWERTSDPEWKRYEKKQYEKAKRAYDKHMQNWLTAKPA